MVDNAPQIFVTDSSGTRVRQLTKLGGELPFWSPDGSYFTFSRDIHKGTGFQDHPALGGSARLSTEVPSAVHPAPDRPVFDCAAEQVKGLVRELSKSLKLLESF